MLPLDWHYAFPQALYLSLVLLLFLLLYSRLYYFRRHKSALFIPTLIMPPAKSLYWLRVCLLSAGWILAIFALMQPLANGHYLEGHLPASQQTEKPRPKRKAHAVIVLIDASASMGVLDSRLGNSRLDYAKEIADQILATLTGESAALYAFTSEVDELSPLTPDSFFVRVMLTQLEINQGGAAGTNLFEALSAIRIRYFSKPWPTLKTLIIISDGADTAIEGMPKQERQKAVDALASLVGDAENMNLRVFTIGMGTEQGGTVPNVQYKGKSVTGRLFSYPLQRLAQVGRGSYYIANNSSALNLAEEIHQLMLQDPPYYEPEEGFVAGSLLQAILGESSIVYACYFYYPLGLAIILLMLAWVLPICTQSIEKVPS